MFKNCKQLIIFLFILSFVITPSVLFAANTPLDQLNTTLKDSEFSKVDETSAANIIGYIIAAFLSVLGIIFMVMLTYGGLLWTSAGGNEEKVNTAKRILRNSIIGILITGGSYAIYALVNTFLTGN